MKINNLKVGQIIKNYQELCNILEIKSTGGNIKKANLKELERFTEYHKEGNKFIIDKIYKIPKKKQDARSKGNHSVFIDDIELLILDLLAQKENKGTVSVSVGKLLEQLNMINKNYRECRQNIPRLSELLNISQNEIYGFYNDTHSKLKDNLKRALEQLRKKRLVYVSNFLMVCDGNDIHRSATKEELETIIEVENKVLSEMGYDNVQSLYLSRRWKEYKTKVNRRLFKLIDIVYYYECYKITNYKQGVLKLLDKIKRKDIKTNINQNVKLSCIKTSERKHHKAKGSIAFGKSNDIALSKEYLTNTKKMVDTVIDEEAKTIKLLKYKR